MPVAPVGPVRPWIPVIPVMPVAPVIPVIPVTDNDYAVIDLLEPVRNQPAREEEGMLTPLLAGNGGA